MRKTVCVYLVGGAVALFFAAQVAMAGTVHTLTFDQLNGASEEEILNYYNGGFGSLGSGPGPSWGITFNSNALALESEDQGGPGNFTNEPSCCNIMFFLTGTGDVLNDASGITTGFSFYYSGNSEVGNGSVDIYTGLNGTGTLLASFVVDTSLTPLCTSGPAYCVWEPDGVAFSGTAESVVFGGAANYIGWDNVTIGSSSPVPEASTITLLAVILLGTGLAGLATKLRGRRQLQS